MFYRKGGLLFFMGILMLGILTFFLWRKSLGGRAGISKETFDLLKVEDGNLGKDVKAYKLAEETGRKKGGRVSSLDVKDKDSVKASRSFRVLVLDAVTRLPLEGIQVTLCSLPMETDSAYKKGETDSKGEFLFPVLSQKMRLSVNDVARENHYGFDSKNFTWKGENKKVVLLTRRDSSLLVCAKDHWNVPIPNVPFKIWNPERIIKRTNKNGECLFTNLPSGENLRAVAIVDGPWKKNLYSLPATEWKYIRLLPKQRSKVTFFILRRGSLKVWVHPPKGPVPLEPIYMTIRSLGGPRDWDAPRDRKLTLNRPMLFSHLPPGKYRLLLKTSLKSKVWLGGGPVQIPSLVVKENMETEYHHYLIYGHHSIKGMIQDERGTPVGGVLVEVLRFSNGRDYEFSDNLCTGRSNSSGVFSFHSLPPGKYWIHVNPERLPSPFNFTLSRFSIGGGSFLNVKVPSDEAKEIKITVTNGWEVQGHVYYKGRIVESGEVRLKNAKGKEYTADLKKDKKRGSGFFQIRHLPVGNYRMIFGKEGKFSTKRIHLGKGYENNRIMKVEFHLKRL